MKNVLLFSLDSLRADALGCYGNKKARTETIDFYAQKGLLFENVIVQAPYTVASHASIFTGLYPFNHGLKKQFTSSRVTRPHLRTFLTLKDYDYKLLSFVGAKFFGPEYGYDFWDYQGWSKLFTISRKFREYSGQRFFAFIHYWGTHTPYYGIKMRQGLRGVLEEGFDKIHKNDTIHIPKLYKLDQLFFGGIGQKLKEIRGAYESGDLKRQAEIRAGYCQSVERADLFIRNVLDKLQKNKLLEKTLIVITADHGESFNEYNEIKEFPHDYEHGPFLYDNVIKVPLIIWDSDFAKGKTIQQQVQSIDILPTILDLIGLKNVAQQARINGRSLVRYMHDQPADDDYGYAYSETYKDSASDQGYPVEKACIRSKKGHKVVKDYQKNASFLYDCNNKEHADIKALESELFGRLQKVLDEFRDKNRIGFERGNDWMDEDRLKIVKKRLQRLGYLD